MTWGSKMQTETALSTTEAKFIALSEGLCMTIPKMNLIEELKEETLECQAAKPRSSAEFLRKILC